MSTQQSKKYHSITIGTNQLASSRNTWDDWFLIPSPRPLVNPPPVKTSYVEIPGGDGILDLTTAMTGKPMYSNRTGSWEFYVENGHKGWSALYSEIMDYLHGEKMICILDDDPMYYYEGRFSVNQWRSDPAQSMIVIDYNLAPYKRFSASDENWLWDPFNFETGVIRYYRNLPVWGSMSITVIGDRMDVIPVITVANDYTVTPQPGMSVNFNGVTYRLQQGANYNDSIVITEGDNPFTFYGYGIVSFQIVGGIL